jgi:transposase InsO family protein
MEKTSLKIMKMFILTLPPKIGYRIKPFLSEFYGSKKAIIVSISPLFHTLKVEEVYGQTYETRQEAKSSIFEYIEIFYNRKRRHSYIELVSPLDFEYKYNQKTYENAA